MRRLHPRVYAFTGILAPLLIVLVLHGLWLLMPLEPLTPRRAPSVPVLTAYPNPGSQSWTPILFSLPSPSGFSGVTRGDPVSVLPPLQSPLELSTRRPFAVSAWFPEPKLPSLRIPETVSALSPATPLRPPRASEPRYQWVFRVLEEGGGRLQTPRLPRVPPLPRAIHLEGVALFDRFGQVAHLLIDPPGVPEGQRGEIIQSLQQIRIWPDTAPARLRFRLSLEPRNP